MPPARSDAQRAFKSGLRAERFDSYIHADAVRKPPNFSDSIDLSMVEYDIRAHALRHRGARPGPIRQR